MSPKSNRVRNWLVSGALLSGAAIGAAGVASAATAPSASTSSGTTATAPTSGQAPSAANGTAPNPATMSHGPNETLLTGSDLSSATTAAQDEVSGATVIRAETDSSGTSGVSYEVHMKKSDGTDVTVQLDSSFKVVATVSGFGPGPAGSQPPTSSAPTTN